MNIRVFTDLRFTTHPSPTGVSKHILQMASGLNQIQDNNVSVLAARDQTSHHRSGCLSFLEAREMPISWKMSELVWTLTGYPYADRWCGNPDWLYCPKNDFIPVQKSRVAVTIHGAHELDPQLPQSGSLSARLIRLRRITAYGRMLRQASLVLTVSEFLKKQMIDWFKVPEDKFCVVGNGVEQEFFRAAYRPRGASGQPSDRPFVICVGGLNELDGGDRIIRVAKVLRQQTPDLKILVAGCDHNPVLTAKASQLHNVQLLGYVGSERLALLMRDALALFYPTRYETFGIAAAEAMAVGTPVVTCRSTAVPEILGAAGIYTAENSPGEMAGVLQELLNNETLRLHHANVGLERAVKFTWKACLQRLSKALSR